MMYRSDYEAGPPPLFEHSFAFRFGLSLPLPVSFYEGGKIGPVDPMYYGIRHLPCTHLLAMTWESLSYGIMRVGPAKHVPLRNGLILVISFSIVANRNHFSVSFSHTWTLLTEAVNLNSSSTHVLVVSSQISSQPNLCSTSTTSWLGLDQLHASRQTSPQQTNDFSMGHHSSPVEPNPAQRQRW